MSTARIWVVVMLAGPLVACAGPGKRKGHISFERGSLIRHETKASQGFEELELSVEVVSTWPDSLVLKIGGTLHSTSMQRPVYARVERFKVLNSAGQAALAQAKQDYKHWAAQQKAAHDAREAQRQHALTEHNPSPMDRMSIGNQQLADGLSRFGAIAGTPKAASFFGDPSYYDIETARVGDVKGQWEPVRSEQFLAALEGARVDVDLSGETLSSVVDESGLARFDLEDVEESNRMPTNIPVRVQYEGTSSEVVVRLPDHQDATEKTQSIGETKVEEPCAW